MRWGSNWGRGGRKTCGLRTVVVHNLELRPRHWTSRACRPGRVVREAKAEVEEGKMGLAGEVDDAGGQGVEAMYVMSYA